MLLRSTWEKKKKFFKEKKIRFATERTRISPNSCESNMSELVSMNSGNVWEYLYKLGLGSFFAFPGKGRIYILKNNSLAIMDILNPNISRIVHNYIFCFEQYSQMYSSYKYNKMNLIGRTCYLFLKASLKKNS